MYLLTYSLILLCFLGRSKDADGNFSFLKDNSPSKDLTKEGEQELIILLCIFILSLRPSHPIVQHNLTECERVIVSLLVEDILHPNIVYTAYNTIVYLRLGPRGQACLNSKNLSVEIDLPLRTNKKAASSKKSLAETDENGWISRTTQTNKTKSKKRTSKTAGKTKATKAKKSKTTKKTSSKRKSAKSKMPTIVDIVEIDSSSSSSSESDDEMVLAKRASRNKKQKVIFEESSDDDSEFELSD